MAHLVLHFDPIVIMFPFLVVSIVSEKGYPYFLKWPESGLDSFYLDGFYYKIRKHKARFQ
jgi:1-acyl-sn-glycerol-3-phosphate acyltransferase